MRLILLFICIFLPFIVPAQSTCPSEILEGYDDIRFNTIYSEACLPDYWRKPEIAPKGESLSVSETERSKKLVLKALAKYPKEILLKNIQTIHCLKSLRFYGVSYGGTNSYTDIYICNNGIVAYYTDEYLEKTFHHEFSSILLRNYMKNLDVQEWNKLLPKGFSYGSGGKDAISAGKDSMYPNDSICSRGFVCEYGTASLEEDFNTFAELLFTCNHTFRKNILNHEILRKKAELVIGFYRKLHPLFTPDYFKSIYEKDCTK